MGLWSVQFCGHRAGRQHGAATPRVTFVSDRPAGPSHWAFALLEHGCRGSATHPIHPNGCSFTGRERSSLAITFRRSGGSLVDRQAPERRVTLAAVARDAGVSVATVSKVVNGRTDVASDTRARVGELLTRHGYVARGAGGVQPITRTVELLFDALQTPNNLEIARGAIEAAAVGDVDVVVGIVPDDPLGAAWTRRVSAARHEGVILVTSAMSAQQWQHFVERGIPVVAIDPVNVPSQDVPSVGATNFTGGMEAAAHLIDLGHRRIGLIEGPPEAMVSIARSHGFRAALARAGLTPEPELIRTAAFTFDAGVAAAMEILSRRKPPTAVLTSSDLQALGVVEAARTRGLRVPEDLSVVGFDDMPTACWSAPPLTTVRQPFAEMGRVAMRRLLRRIAGEQLTSPRIELATEIVVRRSTAPYR
ncbi:substrate-binding domain-containing protein [Actinoplanes sp. NPDC049548]|uniref:LacI family DNA-binding transcriptional regulator n=1 Tax=Actinoplanes sp. NPDC049548 TaxID=3155152 RepID=UPI0034424228